MRTVETAIFVRFHHICEASTALAHQPNRYRTLKYMNAEHFRALRHCCTLYQFLLVVVLVFVSPAASHLLSIPLTSPSLVYTPFVCNATEVLLDPNVCQGGWQLSDDPPQVSTIGSSKPILPQIFFRFRASSIYIKTSTDSNATVDIIVAWESVTRRSIFDSSLGFIGIINLPDNSTFLLTVTVNPSTSSTLFVLTSIEITTPSDVVISSVLPPPTITLSSPIFPTSFTSQTTNPNTFTTTSTPSQGDQKLSRQMVKLAIGLTVGLGVGLTLIAILLYWLFRRRRRRKSGPRRWRWSFVT